jgi:hypothetical protein
MFNLEESIVEWRRQMLAAGVKNPAALDELESHLREDAERLMRSGSSAEQAFETAVQRIGHAGLLKHEFAKVGGKKWVLLGKLKGIIVDSVAPVPSLSTFTPSARQTLELARTEAPRLHHNFVGTEHVLLGLLALENGVVPNVLKRMGVDREGLRKQVEQWVSVFPSEKMTAKLPYTFRVKKALRFAAGEAKACRQACVGAEHIFLGLLRERDGVAARVLKNLGVKIQTAREEILNEYV